MPDEITTPAAPYHLVVIQPFGDYEKGQQITDAAEIKTVLDGENAFAVVKIMAA